MPSGHPGSRAVVRQCAAAYASCTCVEIRPRLETSYPFSLAHSRIFASSSEFPRFGADFGAEPLLPPDIHIFTASKQPWVVIPEGAAAVPEYYDRERHWPETSLARRRAILPQIDAYRASRRPRA